MKGYIKDHRRELMSDIWLMPPLYHRVWQWLKYQANHRDAEIPMSDGTRFLIRRGQHLTSIRNIARGVGWYEGMAWKEPNPKTISNILEWLSEQNMITIDRGRGNRQYTLITLVNWEFYQDTDGEGVTVDGEGSKQLLDINNNDKNDKKNSQVYKTIISYLNEKTGKRFSYKSQANRKLINGRMAEGRTIDDFKYVIDVKCDHWLDNEKMNEYLRPATLFAQTNFENYLNQKPKVKQMNQRDPRDKEIALQQWIQEGNDPDEFNWGVN